MPRKNPRDAVVAELAKFDKEIKANKEKNKQIKEQNDLLLADAEQENAKAAKAEEASASTKHNRKRKSTKANDAYIQKYKEFKQGSLKAYDNFVAAMMEIAALVEVLGKSLNADVRAFVTGPLYDWATASKHDAAAATMLAAAKVAENPELALEFLTKNPLDMVSVTSKGDLNFELFQDDKDIADKNIPHDFLKNADRANENAVRFLVKMAGYEYDSVLGGYKHEDTGVELKSDDLASIVKSADFEALIGDAIKNQPSNPSPGSFGP